MNTDAMMIYKCGRDTIHALDRFDEVIDFLKTVGSCRPVTTREVGCFAYGEDYFFTEYGQKKVDKTKSAHLGQMLRHLRQQRLVERVELMVSPSRLKLRNTSTTIPTMFPALLRRMTRMACSSTSLIILSGSIRMQSTDRRVIGVA